MLDLWDWTQTETRPIGPRPRPGQHISVDASTDYAATRVAGEGARARSSAGPRPGHGAWEEVWSRLSTVGARTPLAPSSRTANRSIDAAASIPSTSSAGGCAHQH